MTNLDSVVTALAARIATGMAGTAIAGRSFAYSVDSPIPPCAITLPSENPVVYDVTFDGQDDFELIVKLLVGTAVTRTAQAELMGYLDRSGSTSIRAAIYGDRTLGGTVSDVAIADVSQPGDVDWGGVMFYGCEITVQAFA